MLLFCRPIHKGLYENSFVLKLKFDHAQFDIFVVRVLFFFQVEFTFLFLQKFFKIQFCFAEITVVKNSVPLAMQQANFIWNGFFFGRYYYPLTRLTNEDIEASLSLRKPEKLCQLSLRHRSQYNLETFLEQNWVSSAESISCNLLIK